MNRARPADRTMWLALAIALGAAAAILGALFFEYVVRLAPCPLCLQQRLPHYLAIPLALLVAEAARRRVPRALVATGFVLLAGLMLWTGGLGIYHAGVEWAWWAGPQDCSATNVPQLGSATDLLRQMGQTRVVRCDEAPWRWLGLSLAGWNVVVAAALAATALLGAAQSLRRH